MADLKLEIERLKGVVERQAIDLDTARSQIESLGHFREDYYRIKVEHELLQDEHAALNYRHQENLLRYQGLEDTLSQMGK